MIDWYLELSGITQAVLTWLAATTIFALFLCSHFSAEKEARENCDLLQAKKNPD